VRNLPQIVLTGLLGIASFSTTFAAERVTRSSLLTTTGLKTSFEKPSPQNLERVQPCLGRGYVAYSYPSFGSCQCESDCCFHPGRYYCGGKPYRKQWFRTWVRAHLGHGSMLDNTPCQCIYPTASKSFLRPPRVSARPEPRFLPPIVK